MVEGDNTLDIIHIVVGAEASQELRGLVFRFADAQDRKPRVEPSFVPEEAGDHPDVLDAVPVVLATTPLFDLPLPAELRVEVLPDTLAVHIYY